ncbi:MAG: hypothetical protein A3H06_00525 [Candidatus Colwellbacteria bacterium RIFCSPLOWO2_12_FULL_44_13]|uniref:Bacterial type II secretion system protein E domain-containing protein n=3 Tax=Candidatus Colwelliibacteriota TaxID=1817904 RepID=A0A1G1Z5U1_9BACT|nr:MAG: hypothetical protein A3F24_00710 [Candidatus Colwellbacteria bacterium RIFCSPHIGHO2_12_FULL_44_17]OGY59894.1 MAG: hypothetical protein A3I31_01915 [Candidatus Colwellbacteria bacterium RIFCSPLOWO2_02_FULL_44_20b]OGY61740.1 MAG: hypothetical protein A3H06_00525 [Candidatus Colwellbacteria bacterium RIFCSPLOWO2_12_FULL_44_13]
MEAKTLLNKLVEKTLLTSEAAKKIGREAELLQKPVEDLLYGHRLVDEIELTKLRSELLSIPYEKVNLEEITPNLLKLIPSETAQNYKVIPLARTKEMLTVGMVNPEDIRAQEALRFVAKELKINLGVYLVAPSDVELVLRKYSPYKTEIEAAIKSLNIKPGSGVSAIQRIIHLEEGADVSEEAPVIKIVASTLKEAVESGASDVHIEPQRSRVRIRFRVDGDLHEVSSFPIELHQPIVSRIKILSNLKIDELRVPQDGRFRTVIFGRDIDYRVATFPTPVGEKVAIRVLDPSIGLKGLDNLGLIGRSAELVKEGIEKPFGMVLITGPTGSGKTTTLYSLLQILNKEESNVVSLEDPVEYFVDGLNQSQVHPEIGYDFASGLRQILRQDPDVIMVGEIRDSETASLAVHAALTGHIVLSTLHTNNALGVIPRLIDMGVDAFLLPMALNTMVAQRLVGKICEKCKKAENPSPELQKIIEEEVENMPETAKKEIKAEAPYKIWHAPGCDACKGKGISGRVALFEVITMTRELGTIIAGGATGEKIREEANRQQMISLRTDGIVKALNGLVMLEEVLRETSDEEE